MLATERVLCFMTMHEFFDFFYHALNAIKNTFVFPTTVQDVKTQAKVANMTERGQSMLAKLYSQDVRMYTELSVPSFRNSHDEFTYLVPDFDSLRRATIKFCCPLLFDALDLGAFLELLTAVLTERSVLFASQDLNLLSSAV